MLRDLAPSKFCCIFETVLERNPKLEAYLLLTRQTEIWYISTDGQRVTVSAYMNLKQISYIQRGALFLFVFVGFTRALFATKLSTTLRFLMI